MLGGSVHQPNTQTYIGHTEKYTFKSGWNKSPKAKNEREKSLTHMITTKYKSCSITYIFDMYKNKY